MKDGFTKGEVNRAGDALRLHSADSSDLDHAIDIVDYWRQIHLEPLREMMEIIYGYSEGKSLPVAGRVKKFDTIVDKLRRIPTVKLSTMYDIAGCRIVVENMVDLEELCSHLELSKNYDREKSIKKNYLVRPHPSMSGYRSKHLIFKFDALGCEKILFVELQVRTRLQHLWSTAVELYDKARKTRMKFGESNPASWQFFRRASELIKCLETGEEVDAKKIRDAFPVKGGSQATAQILAELGEASESVSILRKLDDEFEYCLIDFIPTEQTILLFTSESEMIIELYSEHERILQSETGVFQDRDTVLVRGSSIDQLAILYPNYFGDISGFLELPERYPDVFR